jgi:hypothetical protein
VPVYLPKAPINCSRGLGNSSAYNGYAVFDHAGTRVGTVHEAQVNASLKLTQIRFLTTVGTPHFSCVSVSNTQFVTGPSSIVLNADASRVYQARIAGN